MSQASLLELSQQAVSLLSQIRNHPHFKRLNYQPDVTISDAEMAISSLIWELEAQGESSENILHPMPKNN